MPAPYYHQGGSQDMQQNTNQDEQLARKILAYLNENSGSAFTVQELAEERHIYSSRPLIQKSLAILLREGLVKVKNKGNLPGYQAVLREKAKTRDSG
jgi:DNA-binding IscR family transcriptional regulator